MRERYRTPTRAVTPYVGVWIEITRSGVMISVSIVTPDVGVWIEIKRNRNYYK